MEPGIYTEAAFDGSPTAFWISWIENQAQVQENIQQLIQPVAVLSGTEDYNIPPEHTEQQQAWRGDDPRDLFKVYQGLTHSLIKYYPASNTVGDHVNTELLTDLTIWLNDQEQ